MILTKKVQALYIFFICIKIFSQNTSDQKASLEIDSLLKKGQKELAHFKLSQENIKFERLSKYDLSDHLYIKFDSATALYKKGEYLNAEKAVLSTLNEVENNKNELSLPIYEGLKHTAISRLFYIEKRLGNVSQGLKYLKFFSQGLSPIYQKKQRIFFAVAYIELGNYKKGIQVLDLRINDIYRDRENILCSNFRKSGEIAATYNTKGDAFIKWYKDTGQKQFLDSSKLNYERAYQIMKHSSIRAQYSKTLLTNRLAHIALLKKQYNYSLSLYNSCEKDLVLMEKNFSRETVWLGKAEIYTFLKKTDSAFYYINKVYNKKTEAKCAYDTKLKIYHLLSINYENTGESKNAYRYAKLSLSEMEKKRVRDTSGNAFLGMYEQQEIKSVSKEMVKKNRRFTFFLIVLLVLTFSGIIFFIVYRNNKRKKKTFLEFQKKIDEIHNFNIYPVTTEKIENPIIIEDELVNQILKKIDLMESDKKFLSNNFKLAQIAKQLNTNTTYLSQIINQHKGMTFSEYVNNLRINYVLKELNSNAKFRKYTIQAMSEELGYKSPTTFTNAFKSRVKMTPLYYIQQLEKNNH
ncbi:AraC-like DNA-binding protein [Chryseobacterium defluvii]|uniref:AraC-like DNA-binding protein n=1 Tax=Chryseobacterium defluvii TaxID=160396 RepID=A0A840KD36_9FLAO|nr:response regulator transcription factor [Chryseobacterium defluvii]MBB4807409.1 AraC-like DNA-binding protein [Chryseobacterium defluvii]